MHLDSAVCIGRWWHRKETPSTNIESNNGLIAVVVVVVIALCLLIRDRFTYSHYTLLITILVYYY